MLYDLELMIKEAKSAFSRSKDTITLENEKARFLGRSGKLTKVFENLRKLDPGKRKIQGIQINKTKRAIEEALFLRRRELCSALLDQKLSNESIDVTLPGRRASASGRLHPVMQARERIERIFSSFGFDIVDGPEIENDWFNFSSLNSPNNHPARSMQDTFYIDAKDENGCSLLLRTHTSPMQVRYAKLRKRLPIKVIAPGKAYRLDNDATHSPMFHQIEGLWIDKEVSFADLKGLYIDFLRKFFDLEDIVTRFRPSYFPFTEPSAEIDMKFQSDAQNGNWLEISGAGQVHPNVIRNMGFDPEFYTGFAFGSGLERLVMLRYGIQDLRLFFDGDLRFLKQFI